MLYARYHNSPYEGCSLRIIHDGTNSIAELWCGQHEDMHTMRVLPGSQVADLLSQSDSLVKAFLSLWESLPRDTRNTHWPTRLPILSVPTVK